VRRATTVTEIRVMHAYKYKGLDSVAKNARGNNGKITISEGF